MVFYLFL